MATFDPVGRPPPIFTGWPMFRPIRISAAREANEKLENEIPMKSSLE